jgi:hypothetical protein
MAPEGVRRSKRVGREIPILLFGSDTEGKTFSEETKTVVLSRYGAGIVSEYKLSPEQELVLRRRDTNKEAEFRVVGQIGSHGTSYTYGVAFTGENSDFWGIPFPPVTESDLAATRVVLECIRCEAHEVVYQSDLESDVFLINDGIVRYCKNCGSSTFWKRAPEGTVLGPVPPPDQAHKTTAPELASRVEPAAPIAPAEPPARPANRRRHVRTMIRCQACIRSFEYGDDVVNCEDMSRGGIRFTSRNKYVAGIEIRLAVPYSPGSQGIFVSGQIVRVVENARDKTFQCGVQFIGHTKKE